VQSVVSQDCENFEYIIQDGASSDYTLEIVDEVLHRDGNNVSKIIVSEPDSGVYDAMNRAVKKARGKYVIFMNAGDVFYCEETLSRVVEELKAKGGDVLYGRHVVYAEGYQSNEISPKPLGSLWKRMVFSHQSMFAKRELMLNYPFDVDNLSADHSQIYRMYRSGINFREIDLCICKYLDGGLSVKGYRKSIYNRFRGVFEVGGFNCKEKIMLVFYYFVIFILEPTIYSYRKWRRG
jgi:glycosyltransferase involved in cell wall biosynthesis